MKYPSSIENLIKHFEMFPGVGPKTAERLAFFTITKMDKAKALSFSQSITQAIESIRECKDCGSLTDQDVCDICLDDGREDKLMIVENSKDVLSFEKLGVFNGKYHVLNGTISPMNGVGPDDINLSSLTRRIEEESFSEIIVALSSTIPGEMTAQYIKKVLENLPVLVYRIGYGLPVGADIEYTDEITLTKALEGMKKI